MTLKYGEYEAIAAALLSKSDGPRRAFVVDMIEALNWDDEIDDASAANVATNSGIVDPQSSIRQLCRLGFLEWATTRAEVFDDSGELVDLTGELILRRGPVLIEFDDERGDSAYCCYDCGERPVHVEDDVCAECAEAFEQEGIEQAGIAREVARGAICPVCLQEPDRCCCCSDARSQPDSASYGI